MFAVKGGSPGWQGIIEEELWGREGGGGGWRGGDRMFPALEVFGEGCLQAEEKLMKLKII